MPNVAKTVWSTPAALTRSSASTETSEGMDPVSVSVSMHDLQTALRSVEPAYDVDMRKIKDRFLPYGNTIPHYDIAAFQAFQNGAKHYDVRCVL